MAVTALTKETFFEAIQAPGKVALVDFYADWCGPCQAMAPIVAALSEAYPGIAFYKVNVDEQSALAIRYGVTSIPTLCIFRGGNLAETLIGARPKESLAQTLEKYC